MRATSPCELEGAYVRCAEITRASGSSFLAAFWMFPRAQRRALHAIYAFCRMADDFADDPAVGRDRRRLLETWREELDAAYRGDSRHPVGIAVGDAARRFGLRREWFEDLLSGVESDLRGGPFRTFAELERYCYCVASTVGLLVVSVRGLSGPAVQGYATDLGIAVQLTNVLRDVGEDARAGRIYLAQEDLERMGVSPAELGKEEPSESVRLLLAVYAERARIRYERARAALPPELRRAARPAEAMGAIYRRLLHRLHAERFPCLSESVQLGKAERLAIAARTWAGREARA